MRRIAAAALCAAAACHRAPLPTPAANDADVMEADALPPEPPVEAKTITSAGDLPVYFVAGRGPARFVFFHGACTNGLGYIQSFAFAASARGSILAPQGEHDCGGGLRLWMGGAEKQNARVDAGFLAAGEARTSPIIAIGYSQGANVAEALAAAYPEKYSRLILIGQPHSVDAAALTRLEGAVMMSGTYDNMSVMRESVRRLVARGIPATFIELPKARHGQLPEAERLMGEAFAWLDAHARARIGGL